MADNKLLTADSRAGVTADPVTGTSVGAKRGIDVTSAETFNIEIDDTTTASVTYVGFASPGTVTSVASWRIMKIDESSGTSVTWADGDADFDNVWDNRASLSYS